MKTLADDVGAEYLLKRVEGMAAVHPLAAALKLSVAGMWPTQAAQQLGLGRSTAYRELNRVSLQCPL